MSAATKIVLALRAGHERQGWIHPSLNRWLIWLMYEKVHTVYFDFILGVKGYAGSANAAANGFMERPGVADAEWLCIIDNDTAPPMNIMRMMDDLPDYVDIISPLCPMTLGHSIFPQQGTYKTEDGNEFYFKDGDAVKCNSGFYNALFNPLQDFSPGIHEVDRVGGGFWFIRRRIFEHMEKPYFKVYFNENFEMNVSDDCFFQDAAKKLGFRIFCDTRFVADHFHTLNMTPHMEGIVFDNSDDSLTIGIERND